METTITKPIQVAILDDHQSVLDGYAMRITQKENMRVVATASYGDQLPSMLIEHDIDVLVLDVGVPNSEQDRNPYPILHILPEIKKQHPDMAVLIISMYDQRQLVKALLDAGANGYILKDDREAIMHLGEAVSLVNTGGIYLSSKLRDVFADKDESQGNGVLSTRQREVLSLAAALPDISTNELGKRLNISPSTVRNLLSKSYKRLGVGSRAAATERARAMGLISPFPDQPNVKP